MNAPMQAQDIQNLWVLKKWGNGCAEWHKNIDLFIR